MVNVMSTKDERYFKKLNRSNPNNYEEEKKPDVSENFERLSEKQPENKIESPETIQKSE